MVRFLIGSFWNPSHVGGAGARAPLAPPSPAPADVDRCAAALSPPPSAAQLCCASRGSNFERISQRCCSAFDGLAQTHQYRSPQLPAPHATRNERPDILICLPLPIARRSSNLRPMVSTSLTEDMRWVRPPRTFIPTSSSASSTTSSTCCTKLDDYELISLPPPALLSAALVHCSSL